MPGKKADFIEQNLRFCMKKMHGSNRSSDPARALAATFDDAKQGL